jgi:peptidoglycan-associated lipoprotein
MFRAILGVTLAASFGCASHPKFPLCTSDSDCTSEANNHGAVRCIDGQCQQCKTDADCGGVKSCQSMRCVALAPSSAPAGLPTPSAPDLTTQCHLDKINFAFDSSDLSPQARAILDKVAECLQQKGAVRVRIEGFCDERGTEEYNLALGERRALAVEKYLEALGIQRVSAISYGKENPVCTDNTEACWKRNRRAEFDVSFGKNKL